MYTPETLLTTNNRLPSPDDLFSQVRTAEIDSPRRQPSSAAPGTGGGAAWPRLRPAVALSVPTLAGRRSSGPKFPQLIGRRRRLYCYSEMRFCT